MKEKRILKLEDQNFLTRALNDDAGNKILEGYASVFNQRSKLLFENGKIFFEVIERGAFDDVLASDDLDVLLTYQHDLGHPLARANKARGIKTLSLSVDETGLKFRAILNNTSVANDTFERVKSGDCFECSFVFVVEKGNERWTKEGANNIRYISKVSALFDVSIVVNGAYENTDVAAAERSFKEAEEKEVETPVDDFEKKGQTLINVKNQKRSEMKNEEKALLQYNLGKALRESARGITGLLTGFEKEIQEEGEKEYQERTGKMPTGVIVPEKVMRAFTTANTGHHSEIQGGYDVIADRGILAKLGATIYPELTAQIKLVFSNGFNASIYEEDEEVSEGTPTESYGKIEPKRIQGWSSFTNAFLAQSSTTPTLISDMLASIEAATAKEIFTQILALTPLTGFESSEVAAALTWANVMKLKGAVKSAQFVAPKFVSGGELYSSLEATNKDAGSGRFIIEDSKISGYGAIDAQGLIASGAKNSLIFGDFSKAYVGYFGGLQIMADPYTESNKGNTKLTYVRLGDISVNPYAFKSIQNASI